MTIYEVVRMTFSKEIENTIRLFQLENWLLELQVKQPKNLGHFYPFEFTVQWLD